MLNPYTITILVCSIVATPGRFLHVMMEMDLKLTSVEYVVFDEADRYVLYNTYSISIKPLPKRLIQFSFVTSRTNEQDVVSIYS